MATHSEGVVIDAVATYSDIAVRRRDKAGDDFHQCRLASTVGTQQPHNLTFVDLKRHMVEGVLFAEDLGYIFDFNHYYSILTRLPFL